jgi:hypothetical protein
MEQTNEETAYIRILILRRNQLPVSAAMWQYGCQICFATFILLKNLKIAKNTTTTKAREKLSRGLKFLDFFMFVN